MSQRLDNQLGPQAKVDFTLPVGVVQQITGIESAPRCCKQRTRA
jgi:hypothetical protein